MVKLPAAPPPADLVTLGADVVALAPHTVLWRVHRTAGPHALGWNEMRAFGPTDARFDPHPPPPDDRSGELVLYLALDVVTCLAEVFQTTRVLARRRGEPYLTGLRLTRSVHLLDLAGRWPTRAGASQLLNSGRRDRAREWARSIRAAYPDVDGLWHPSSMYAGRPCVTLWAPAQDALPAEPLLSEPLAHPGMTGALAAAASEIGYRLL